MYPLSGPGLALSLLKRKFQQNWTGNQFNWVFSPVLSPMDVLAAYIQKINRGTNAAPKQDQATPAPPDKDLSYSVMPLIGYTRDAINVKGSYLQNRGVARAAIESTADSDKQYKIHTGNAAFSFELLILLNNMALMEVMEMAFCSRARISNITELVSDGAIVYEGQTICDQVQYNVTWESDVTELELHQSPFVLQTLKLRGKIEGPFNLLEVQDNRVVKSILLQIRSWNAEEVYAEIIAPETP